MKDIYRFWSRKKLKLEISKKTYLYNHLFDRSKALIDDVNALIKERNQTNKKLYDARKKNRTLKKENERLRKEHQDLYDCILRWYEPTNEKALHSLVEETRKLFESFTVVEE